MTAARSCPPESPRTLPRRGPPKRAGGALSPEALRVYAVIAEAAQTGAPAPDAAALASVGLRRDARGLLAQLSRAGMIKLERRAGASLAQKRYFVARSGRWTGWLVTRDRRVSRGREARPATPDGTRGKVLDELRRIAVMGLDLPSGQALAERVGVPPKAIETVVRLLKRSNHIRTEVSPDRRRRRVFVADVGKWTTWTTPKSVGGTYVRRPAVRRSMPEAEVDALYGEARYDDLVPFQFIGRAVVVSSRLPGIVASSSPLA